jgi:hypothetical protein
MGTDLDFGRIGFTDKGDWVSNYNNGNGYEYLDGVTYANCYWISLDNNNTQTPSNSATKWHKAFDGTIANTAADNADAATADAISAATLAETKAGQANTAAQSANSAAQAANEAAQAALDAVVTAELPAVATESNVRNIVKNWMPSGT